MTTIELKDQELSCDNLAALCDEDMIKLSLTNVTLIGDDATSLGKALRGQQDLEEIVLVSVAYDVADLLDGPLSMALVSAPSLARLHIEGTPVSVSALLSAAYATALKELILPKNHFDDAAAVTLASTISANTALKKIDLSDNELSNKGCEAIATALEKNSGVEVVELGGNGKITAEQLTKIAEMTRQGGRAVAA